jgi:hypothetical protein
MGVGSVDTGEGYGQEQGYGAEEPRKVEPALILISKK